MMVDRIAAGIFVALGLAIVVGAFEFYVPYKYEPLGPKAMPYMVGSLLVVCGLRLLMAPSSASQPASARMPTTAWWRLLFCASLLLAYAFSYESLGFFVATSVLGFCLAWICQARIPWCLGVAVGLPLAGHLVLVAGLDLQLPAGLLAGWL